MQKASQELEKRKDDAEKETRNMCRHIRNIHTYCGNHIAYACQSHYDLNDKMSLHGMGGRMLYRIARYASSYKFVASCSVVP